MLACDMVTAASEQGLAKVSREETTAIVNTQETMTGAFTSNPDLPFPGEVFKETIKRTTGENSAHFINATQIATQLLGDSIASNLFMLGYAIQKGHIPLSTSSVEEAIEINGVAIEFNKQALLWGRRAAHDLAAVEKLIKPKEEPTRPYEEVSLEALIEKRSKFLTEYQDRAYAERYAALLKRVQEVERKKTPTANGLDLAVAKNAFKLMAYKDEYEVARLFSDGSFIKKINQQFEGDYRIEFNLAPPLISKKDPITGQLKKRTFGPWMMNAFRLLAKLKVLRGTTFDILGKTEERKTERKLIEQYFGLVDIVLSNLNNENHHTAVELLSLPEQIRGYGHVKEKAIKMVKSKERQLLERFNHPELSRTAAE